MRGSPHPLQGSAQRAAAQCLAEAIGAGERSEDKAKLVPRGSAPPPPIDEFPGAPAPGEPAKTKGKEEGANSRYFLAGQVTHDPFCLALARALAAVPPSARRACLCTKSLIRN